MKRPSDPAIDRFVDTLVRNGVAVTVRRSKGREIAAACGQLRGKTEAPRRRVAAPASGAGGRERPPLHKSRG
jgi:23S rRNA (adenine2503-C2)-methyltransferase